MLAPISWLRDYVDITVSPNTLAKKLVSIGFEVEDIIYQERQVSKVVVGKIIQVEKHPNADKLKVCQIDIGKSTIQVVTNVAVDSGIIIAVALNGAVLADDFHIKRGELRGVLSEGMLCGLEELALTTDDVQNQAKGDIIRFCDGTTLGQNALIALGYNDIIFDISVTANRPDCNSIYKIAKEIAVALKTTCKEPEIAYNTVGGNVNNEVSVEIVDTELCPRYMASSIKNVKIFQSSQLIKSRLNAVGIRPINNIVDITNYVLIEIGQPMHAFDKRDLIDNKIIVRKSNENESIVTLDGKENKLNDSMLVICDNIKPVALAGIMGGDNSGIKDDTTQIVFESAKFCRANIRRTSRTLNLRSNSSARFEKGIDFASQEYGLKRAMTLIYQTNSGDIIDGIVDKCVSYPKSKEVFFTLNGLKKILGCKVPHNSLISILSRLGISVSKSESGYIAHIPEHREDIVGINDIAEEFIRVYGYSTITPTLFAHSSLTKGGKGRKIQFLDNIKEIISSNGANECVTYSFTSPKFADMLNIDKDSELRKTIQLINPLGEALSVMRTTLTHSMLEILASNFTHFNKSACLFEVARVYLPETLPIEELPYEEEKLIIGAYGQSQDFFTIKGMVESLFDKLKISVDFNSNLYPFLHPGRSANILIDDDVCVGYVGEVHPDTAEKYGLDTRAYICELSLDKIFDYSNNKVKFESFSKFPAVERDLAVVVGEDIPAGKMTKAVLNSKINYLAKAEIFDTYLSDQIGKGKKSIAMSFTFTSTEKTLVDEEITKEMSKILSLLKKKFGAKIR